MLASIPRIALVGPMGIGKTTAVRALCGALMSTSDVPNLDRASHTKEFTTVGTEFGEIDLGGGERVQICGCPGQERFDFVRNWVLSVSVGVFVMVDVQSPTALAESLQLLREAAEQPQPPLALVLSTRPATAAQLEAFGAALAAAGCGIVPILEADPRERGQLLDAIGALAAMLSLQHDGAAAP